MDDPIIPVEMLQAKAKAAYGRREGRDSHGFNWHSTAAISVWQAEWDRCADEEAEQSMLAQAAGCPP